MQKTRILNHLLFISKQLPSIFKIGNVSMIRSIIHVSTIAAILIGISDKANAQRCDCKKIYNWTKATFEQKDAGAQYVIQHAGKTAYNKHNATFAMRIAKTTDKAICATTINEWLSFFRKGHLGFYAIEDENTGKSLKHYPTVDSKIETNFKIYLDTQKGSMLEGIWESDAYRVGIKNIQGVFTGFILESSNKEWQHGQIKFTINKDLTGTYYRGDHSATTFKKAELTAGNVLKVDNACFRKVFPETKMNANTEFYFESINSAIPFARKINNARWYIRLPSFDATQKPLVDSLILALKSEITSTKNLIIDIRDNGGGAGKTYNELLPLLYTHPIKTTMWEYYSTPLNNERWKNWLNNPDVASEEKPYLRSVCAQLDANIGKFVYIYNKETEIYRQQQSFANPVKIAILINGGNGSAAEQFLLSARQSWKVKLFGKPTCGVLDISEMNQVKSPDGNFILFYCLTKSLRLPEYPIDGIGIQPDFYLDDSVGQDEWVNYTNKFFEGN
jgi:hypothetical protein